MAQDLTPTPPDERPDARVPNDFTPVPRLCERHDGWTAERQRGFIEALADYGSVRAAANSVGLAAEGAYRLRRQPGAEEFAAAWEAALDHGVRRVEDVAMDRALNGVEVPVYSYGKLVGTRTVYNDRLLMFMLRNRAPERFCADGARGLNAVDRMRQKRLKEAWRQEWLEERRAEEPDIEEVRQDVLSKVEAMAAAERERWTPRERELHEQLAAERAAREAREEEQRRVRFRRDDPQWCEWEAPEEEEDGEHGNHEVGE
jgi:hypothetical protein